MLAIHALAALAFVLSLEYSDLQYTRGEDQ
jgi:hypothetical protein